MMQINTNTMVDRNKISHNAWLESVPKENITGQ